MRSRKWLMHMLWCMLALICSHGDFWYFFQFFAGKNSGNTMNPARLYKNSYRLRPLVILWRENFKNICPQRKLTDKARHPFENYEQYQFLKYIQIFLPESMSSRMSPWPRKRLSLWAASMLDEDVALVVVLPIRRPRFSALWSKISLCVSNRHGKLWIANWFR